MYLQWRQTRFSIRGGLSANSLPKNSAPSLRRQIAQKKGLMKLVNCSTSILSKNSPIAWKKLCCFFAMYVKLKKINVKENTELEEKLNPLLLR